jgi:hypothetical protein
LPDMLTDALCARLREMTVIFERHRKLEGEGQTP